jgi:hypothetical protein
MEKLTTLSSSYHLHKRYFHSSIKEICVANDHVAFTACQITKYRRGSLMQIFFMHIYVYIHVNMMQVLSFRPALLLPLLLSSYCSRPISAYPFHKILHCKRLLDKNIYSTILCIDKFCARLQ